MALPPHRQTEIAYLAEFGEAAVYVTPNDVQEYAEAIVALMDDEPKRTQLGQLGRARVEKELAWPHQRQAYVDVYQRLTADSKTASQARA